MERKCEAENQDKI